jgi:signal transduction histidine kinase
MGIREILLLLLLVAVIILLFLTPLMISATWFSKIVVGEVHRNEQKKEELRREYERKRNRMLSDIAHDLRTPITTIAGYSKALNDGMVTSQEKTKEYLEAIESKSERMSELIKPLFDYVKLDSPGFILRKEAVDLTELLRESAALLYPDAEEKGMELEILIPEEACMVELDRLQASRVIANLIGNAIKHNESGTTITLQMLRDEKKARIVVADDGEVIEDHVAKYIFEPFMVGDASRMTKGGSGLGLSIVKRIVDMHGWTIALKQNDLEYRKAFVIDVIL